MRQGQWVQGKTAGGCRNYKSWLSNPQFFMRFREKSEVVVILCQHTKSETVDNSIGFYILRARGLTYIFVSPSQSLVSTLKLLYPQSII